MIKKLKQSFLFHLVIIIFFSFLFYRGRLGSDDIEVFNFVRYFINSDLNLKEFIGNLDLYIEQMSKIENIQYFNINTWSHRFIWIIQTYVITKIIFILNLFWNFDKIFVAQYFSGYILTIYTFLSYLLVFYFLRKKNNFYFSFFLSTVFFFGSGLVSFFTGSYIESLILLFFTLRQITLDKKKIFFYDFFIILIKPYYFIYIFFLYFNKKNLTENIKLPFLLLLLYFIIKIYVNSFSGTKNISMLLEFLPTFNIFFIINNLYNFYFSFGVGIFFSSTLIIILVLLGYSKRTSNKIFGLFFLSLFFCLWEGFHGYAPGGRYFLPIIITFLPEIEIGFKKILDNSNKISFRLLSRLLLILLLFNLPVLEYRNTNWSSYIGDTVYNNKNLIITKVENNKLTLINTPINSIYYNHMMFANIVLIKKFSKNDSLKIDNVRAKIKSIYPMTGIARIIFISNNDINILDNRFKTFLNDFKFILVFIYYTIAMSFICSIFISYKYLKNYNK